MRQAVFESVRLPFLFLPFVRIVSRITAEGDGLSWVIQSKVAGIVVRNVEMFRIAWSEIADVTRDNSGSLPGVRILPKDPDRFRTPVSKYGPIRVNLRVDTDGSGVLKMKSDDRARELYTACKGYISNDMAEAGKGSS